MPPLAALIADVVLTAFWPILGQAGTNHFDPILFTQAGALLGAAALAPLAGRRGWARILSPGIRGPMFWMGFFGTGITSVFFICALQYTTPANAAIMAQIEVLYSALLCAWLLGERVSREQAAASCLVVAGTGLIMGHDLSTPRWKGDLMILLTPWMFQVSHIFAKRLPADLDAATISAGRTFYGALSILPAAAWALSREPRWSWQAGALGILLLQGLSMNCVNLLLWYRAIRSMDLSKATAIMLSYPALTVLFSWGLGWEAIQAVQLAGLCLTFAGACWLSRLVAASQAQRPMLE